MNRATTSKTFTLHSLLLISMVAPGFVVSPIQIRSTFLENLK
jgi:hypothetical protein